MSSGMTETILFISMSSVVVAAIVWVKRVPLSHTFEWWLDHRITIVLDQTLLARN
jgi:hypothetical protein